MSVVSARAKKTPDRLVYTTSLLALFLAFVVSGPLFNQVAHYTTSDGSPIEKLHPFVYVIALGWILDFVFFRHKAIRRPDRYSALAAAWFLLVIFLVGIGSAGYATTVLNNFVFPLILVSQILRLSHDRATSLGKIFLVLMIVQTVLVFGEFAVGRTLFPATQEAAYFRPAGFAGHPLSAGQYALLAILTTRVVVLRPMASRFMILLFLASLTIIGSRSALLVGTMLVLFELLRPSSIRRNALSAVFDFGAAILAGLVFLTALALGGLDRFLERGIWDGSSQSRIAIFDIFNLLDSSELLHGVGYDRLDLYLEFLRQNYVESPFVAQVVVGGIFFAIAAHALIVASFLPTLRASPLFFFTMIGVLVSSLAFSSKGTFPLLASILAAVMIAVSKAHKRESASRAQALPGASQVPGRPLVATS